MEEEEEEYQELIFTLSSEVIPAKSVFRKDDALTLQQGVVIDDACNNPCPVTLGLPVGAQNLLRCHVCFKFSPKIVYEVSGAAGQLLCNVCHQFLKNAYVFLFGGKPEPSKSFSKLLSTLSYGCVNPGCNEAVHAKDWTRHLNQCNSGFLKCPDHHCGDGDKLIAKDSFIQHYKDLHCLELKTKTPFEFYWEQPSNLLDSKNNVSVVAVFEATIGQVMYLVAQPIPPHSMLFACFLLERDVEVARCLKLEITPAIPKPVDMMVRASARINLPGRDIKDSQLFGRSAVFFTQELDKIFGGQTYRFSLQLKETRNMDDVSSLHETTMWSTSTSPLTENSGWKPIYQYTLAKLTRELTSPLPSKHVTFEPGPPHVKEMDESDTATASDVDSELESSDESSFIESIHANEFDSQSDHTSASDQSQSDCDNSVNQPEPDLKLELEDTNYRFSCDVFTDAKDNRRVKADSLNYDGCIPAHINLKNAKTVRHFMRLYF